MLLARYSLETGVIVGVWEATSQTLLEAQIRPEDPVVGYLWVEEGLSLDAATLQEQWVVVGGELVAKSALVIQAAPNPFAADGVSVCAITVEPFVACTLRLNEEPYPLTPEDAVVEVSATNPMRVTVSLEPMRTHWAHAISVEAQ